MKTHWITHAVNLVTKIPAYSIERVAHTMATVKNYTHTTYELIGLAYLNILVFIAVSSKRKE